LARQREGSSPSTRVAGGPRFRQHRGDPISTLTINKKSATIGYTGAMFFSTGSTSATTASVTLQATLTPATGGSPDLTKATPTFLLYKSTNLTMGTPDLTCTATVSSAGVASCPPLSLGLDNWTVVVQEPSNNGYFIARDSDPAGAHRLRARHGQVRHRRGLDHRPQRKRLDAKPAR
jgi:hypothetical protein